MIKRMERAIADALGEAPQGAGWPAERRSRTALALINAYVGLRVHARAGAPAKDLAAVIRTTMQSCGLDA